MTVVRADQKPGRRRAVPEPRQRRIRPHRPRRPEPVAPIGRATETPEPTPPPKPERVRRWPGRVLRLLWLVLTLAGAAAVVAPWTPSDAPGWLTPAGAVTVTTTYAFALAVRTGGRSEIVGALTLALAVAAVVTSAPVLLAAAAISTATIGAVLGVMVTKPAARVPAVARECLAALLVAAVAAFAVDAYEPAVSVERAGYLVLGLSLLGALTLAYRLAAGLHGLGRRGLVMLVSGLGLLAVSLAYTEALARWGSPEVVDTFEQATRDLRDRVGAVPRPTDVPARRPGARLGRVHPGPASPGLVGDRLRCRGPRPRHEQPPRRARLPPRGGPRDGVLPGRGAAARLPRDPRGQLPVGCPRPSRPPRGGGVRPPSGARAFAPAAVRPAVPGARCSVAAMPREARTADVVAEMVANVLSVSVSPGDRVAVGDAVVLLESMKMEIPVLTEQAGTVTAVKVGGGDVVQEGDVLLTIDL